MKKSILALMTGMVVMISGCAQMGVDTGVKVCGEGAAPFSLEEIYWDYHCSNQK